MSALAKLLSHPAVWRGSALGSVATPSVPTGFPALDAELPGGGWPAAALTEILPQHEGIGELRILGHALASLSARGRWLAWIAPPYLPYAPALQAAGIDLARLIVVSHRWGELCDFAQVWVRPQPGHEAAVLDVLTARLLSDGDLLAVHSTREARSGQIVIARLHDEVTVKRYKRTGSRIQLLPENRVEP